MSASLKTTHYELGKYAPEDVTDYLTTYNGTMDAIDEAIYGADTTAQAAQEKSNTNAAQISAQAAALQATNETVTAQGKSIAAQGAEIETLSANAPSVPIAGSSLTGGTNVVGARGVNFSARTIADTLSGFAFMKCDDSARTPNGKVKSSTVPRPALGGNTETVGLCEIFHLSGNPFDLAVGLKWCELSVLTATDRDSIAWGLQNIQYGYYEFDAVANLTRFYIDCGAGQSYTPIADHYAFALTF